jgi:hypothetical protein
MPPCLFKKQGRNASNLKEFAHRRFVYDDFGVARSKAYSLPRALLPRLRDIVAAGSCRGAKGGNPMPKLWMVATLAASVLAASQATAAPGCIRTCIEQQNRCEAPCVAARAECRKPCRLTEIACRRACTATFKSCAAPCLAAYRTCVIGCGR